MATIGRLWAGRIYGTNTGNLFLELNTEGERITGTARFMDSVFGLTIYQLEARTMEPSAFAANPRR